VELDSASSVSAVLRGLSVPIQESRKDVLMGYPIHPDKHKLPAMLTADLMIEFRRRHGGLAGIKPPQIVILCLYKGAMKRFWLSYRSTKVTSFLGDLYLLKKRQGKVAIMGNFGIGSPVVANLADELIAWGSSKLILFSLAGGLQPELKPGSIVLAERAVRDEGTSYHYLPPAKYVEASPALVSAISGALAQRGISHKVGATWSTDAPYRESREEAVQFQQEGVQAVDMESGGLFAVGQLRGVETASVFVIGDSLAAPRWAAPGDMRLLHNKLKTLLNVLVDVL
jgi:uridine phosphorylase